MVGEHFRDLGGGVHGPMCKFGGMEMVHATYVDFSLFLVGAASHTEHGVCCLERVAWRGSVRRRRTP